MRSYPNIESRRRLPSRLSGITPRRLKEQSYYVGYSAIGTFHIHGDSQVGWTPTLHNPEGTSVHYVGRLFKTLGEVSQWLETLKA